MNAPTSIKGQEREDLEEDMGTYDSESSKNHTVKLDISKHNSSDLSPEELLRCQEEVASITDLLGLFIQYSNDILVILDRKGHVIEMGDATLRCNGFKKEEISGRDFRKMGGDLLWKEKLIALKSMLKVIMGYPVCGLSMSLDDIEGIPHPSILDFLPLKVKGKVKYILIIGRDDIAEESLKKDIERADERFSRIAECSADILTIISLSKKPTFTYLSPSQQTILGYTSEELLGTEPIQHIHPDDQPGLKKIFSNYLAMKRLGKDLSGDTEHLLFRFRHKDGHFRSFDSSLSFLSSDEMLFVSRDVTERERMSLEMKKMKYTMDNASMGVLWVTKEGDISYANRYISSLFGTNPEEIVGSPIWQYDPTVQDEGWKQRWSKVQKNGTYVYESQMTTADDHHLSLEISVEPLSFGNEQFHCVFIQDASPFKKLAEHDRRHTEDIKAISTMLFEVLKTRTLEEFFGCINENLLHFMPHSYFFTFLYEPEEEAMRIQLSSGRDTSKMAKIDALLVDWGHTLEVSLSEKDIKELLEGTLQQDKNIYELTNHTVPASICSQLDQALDISTCYTFGFHYDQTLLGCTSVLVAKGDELENVDILKMFFTQASIALQRQLAEEEITQQNIELRKSDRLKTEFLNMTSHELRTPMTSMKGYVQMLSSGQLGEVSEDQRSALDVILRNTDRLDTLVNDILDTSRLESGTMKFATRRTDIKDLVKGAIEMMISSAQQKDITIESSLPEDLPSLFIDSDRIRQVLINLLNNAVKFSPESTTVHVEVSLQDEDMLFTVKDQGIGIPMGEIEKVFTIFHQVEGGADRKFGGSGLGLTISKGLIESHGGHIWAESPGAGKGTTFRFSLPLHPVENVEDMFKKIKIFDSPTDN